MATQGSAINNSLFSFKLNVLIKTAKESTPNVPSSLEKH